MCRLSANVQQKLVDGQATGLPGRSDRAHSTHQLEIRVTARE